MEKQDNTGMISQNAFKGQGRGGRISSQAYRVSLNMAEDFCGLEQNTNRYELLLLVKRAGRSAGFSPRMIALLDYYMSFTRDIDWEEGSRPIIYQSVSKTALDLGVSERQIQKLEKQLFELGAVTWNDSGNHRRYGQRCEKSGAILYAYGVDLTPLAYLRTELAKKLEEKQLYDQAWMETKRQISWYRRQMKAIQAELTENQGQGRGVFELDARYERIALTLRTYMNLEDLRGLLAKHKELHNDYLSSVSILENTHKKTATDEQKFAHYKLTNQKQSDKSENSSYPVKPETNSFQERRSGQTAAKILMEGQGAHNQNNGNSGLEHLTLKQVLSAASEGFASYIPLRHGPITWDDVVEAAYNLKKQLGISQKTWGEACAVLGRSGAAICVLLTDQATIRVDNPVLKPAAYFNGMIAKGRHGELKLHNSIFGILEREKQIEKINAPLI